MSETAFNKIAAGLQDIKDGNFTVVRAPAQPITAWAVVDKDGNTNIDFVFDEEKTAKAIAQRLNSYPIHRANSPHRIARVRIEEITEPSSTDEKP